MQTMPHAPTARYKMDELWIASSHLSIVFHIRRKKTCCGLRSKSTSSLVLRRFLPVKVSSIGGCDARFLFGLSTGLVSLTLE